MVEMRDAEGHFVVGGRSRDKCVMLDVVRAVGSMPLIALLCLLHFAFVSVAQRSGGFHAQDGTQLPLKWAGVSAPVALGTRVTLRIYFRDATIFAVGSGRV